MSVPIDIVDALLVKVFYQVAGIFLDSRHSHPAPLRSLNDTTLDGAFSYKGEFRVLQPIWDLRIGYEKYVASPLFPIVASVSFYFLCMLPFTVCDLWGRNWRWIQKYKIQHEKPVTREAVVNAVTLTFWNQILYILPVSIIQCMASPDFEIPPLAPTIWEFCVHNFLSLVIFDLEYFIWHITHHRIRFLYRHVHSVHHHYSSTSVWVTQYLHPFELISVGIFTTTSPWIFGSHPLTQLGFQWWSIIVSVEDHLGYDFPLGVHRWIPIFGGAIKHDMHHQKPLTNFQPFFNWWDKLIGTECPGQRMGGTKPKALLDWEKEKTKGKYGVDEGQLEAKCF